MEANTKNYKTIGEIFFFLSSISLIIGIAIACKVGDINFFGRGAIFRYSWIILLFIPIPTILFIIGMKQKKTKEKHYKLNCVFGIIFIIFHVVYGISGFIDHNNFNPQKLQTIENKINIELPNSIEIYTQKAINYDVSYVKITDKSEKKEFEKSIKTNQLWQPKLDGVIKLLFPDDIQSNLSTCDAFVFYNLSKSEYNKCPTEGNNDCVVLAYDYDISRLIAIDNFKINLT